MKIHRLTRTAWMLIAALMLAFASEALNAGDSTKSALALSAEARTAISRVHNLHRRSRGAFRSVEEQKLVAIERATRRVRVLLTDAMQKTGRTQRQESMTLLRGEWARWQQLRSQTGAEDPARRPARRRRSGVSLSDELAALEAAIRREIASAEQVQTLASGSERKTMRKRVLDRLRSGREDFSSRYPTAMLSVGIGREETTDVATSEGPTGSLGEVQGGAGTAAAPESTQRFQRGQQTPEILVPYPDGLSAPPSFTPPGTEGGTGASAPRSFVPRSLDPAEATP
jgi:hypothetical protein